MLRCWILWHFHTYVMLCCWMFSCTSAHAPKAMSWTTSANFVLEPKKGTFRRNPRRTKLHFRVCKTLNFPLLRLPFQRICTKNSAQKNKNVQIATVSIIVLGLCDVTTDTASYRRCYHVFGICDCGLCWWPPFINQNDEEVGVARENLLHKYR